MSWQWGIRVDDAGGPRRHETPVSLWSTRSRAVNPLSFTEHRSPQPWMTRFVLRALSSNSKREREREREIVWVPGCEKERRNNYRNFGAFLALRGCVESFRQGSHGGKRRTCGKKMVGECPSSAADSSDRSVY